MKALLLLLATATPLLSHPVLTERFAGGSLTAAWEIPDSAAVSGGALRVHRETQGDALATLPLPLEKLRGGRIEISARVKLENVVKAAESWHGAKVMLQTESPSGTQYQSWLDRTMDELDRALPLCREWHPWNVELGPDPADQAVTPTPSTRQQTLRAGFSKNAPEN